MTSVVSPHLPAIYRLPLSFDGKRDVDRIALATVCSSQERCERMEEKGRGLRKIKTPTADNGLPKPLTLVGLEPDQINQEELNRTVPDATDFRPGNQATDI